MRHGGLLRREGFRLRRSFHSVLVYVQLKAFPYPVPVSVRQVMRRASVVGMVVVGIVRSLDGWDNHVSDTRSGVGWSHSVGSVAIESS